MESKLGCLLDLDLTLCLLDYMECEQHNNIVILFEK